MTLNDHGQFTVSQCDVTMSDRTALFVAHFSIMRS